MLLLLLAAACCCWLFVCFVFLVCRLLVWFRCFRWHPAAVLNESIHIKGVTGYNHCNHLLFVDNIKQLSSLSLSLSLSGRSFPLMRLITAATAVAAAFYMIFVVFYSAKVMFAAVAPPYSAPQRFTKSTGIRSADAQRSSGAASVLHDAASSAEVNPLSVVDIPKTQPAAASIASWCTRMQREGDAIARSFNGAQIFFPLNY